MGDELPGLHRLRMLLRDTPILPDDGLQITARQGFRAFSVRDALAQMGEALTPSASPQGPKWRR